MTESHEDLHRADEDDGEPIGSDRSFGLVFAAFFVVVGCHPLIHGQPARLLWLLAAALLGMIAWVRPAWLRVLNRLWYGFGNVLAGIVSPVALAALYVLGVIPTGFVMRILGKDPLHLKAAPKATTYWILRAPPGPNPKDLPKQF